MKGNKELVQAKFAEDDGLEEIFFTHKPIEILYLLFSKGCQFKKACMCCILSFFPPLISNNLKVLIVVISCLVISTYDRGFFVGTGGVTEEFPNFSNVTNILN